MHVARPVVLSPENQVFREGMQTRSPGLTSGAGAGPIHRALKGLQRSRSSSQGLTSPMFLDRLRHDYDY
jgi:hypothetical protein